MIDTNSILEESLHDVSFTFSEPDDQPQSINIDISEGSPLNSQDFTGAHYNVNSILAAGRLDHLSQISQTLSVDYMIINESKLDENIPTSLLHINGFHDPIRRDRNRHGGGCMVYISKNLTFKQYDNLQSDHFEHIWVDIRVNNKTYSINALYRPPNESADDHSLFLNESEKILKSMLNHKSDNFILASDMNFGNIYSKVPSLPAKPLDFSAPELFESYSLSQIIDIPTRITFDTTSLIDLIFCQNTENIQCQGTLPKIADHDGTFVSFHCTLDRPKPKTKTILDFKNVDEVALIKHLKEIDFNIEVLSKPVFHQAQIMSKILNCALNKFVPVKTVTVRPNDQPWVNSYTRLLLRKKNRNYNFFKKLNSRCISAASDPLIATDIVTRLKDKCTRALKKSKSASQESTEANRRAKQAYFNTVNSTMHNCQISAKKKFSILKKLMKTNKVSDIPPIIEEGLVVTEPESKANIFNQHFASKASVPGANDPAPLLPQKDSILEGLSVINTSHIEVAKLCRDIKKSNSSHCGIPGKFLALIATPISFPLYKMFNNIFEVGYFPDIFKIGHITALFKGKGLKSDKENYRGIHLLPTLSKIAESIIHSRLLHHFKTNNIISERQAAYIKGDSTTQQLLYITHLIKKSWTRGHITQGCFLDASAAFDRCWVNGLLAKLSQVKVEGSCLALFRSYLSNRKICTVIDGEKSQVLEVTAGVPQGSRLGPLLWILYNQDILDGLESECLLFADDTCLFVSGEDPALTSAVLNRDLIKIGNWATKWKVLFNAGKSKDVIFSQNHVLNNSPPLILNDSFVTRANEHKHLGLWLSSNLDWSKQVQSACIKANGKLAVLRSVKFLDRSTLDLLYKLIVRSVLEYGMIVYYNNLKASQLSRLSQVQYRAAKLCTGALHYTSQAKLEKELAWEPLHVRAESLGLTVFYKISTGLTRPLIRTCMPSFNPSTVETRSNRPYNPFPNKSQSFNNSFFPYFTNLYNKLDTTIRFSRDIYDFKSSLKEKLKPAKVRHYCRGVSRLANTLHTQLRVGRSILASHGFAVGQSSTDLCVCGKPETTSHFLISCQLYKQERIIMFETILKLIPKFTSFPYYKQLDILLFGINIKNRESDPRNLPISFAVQNFILKTKRFSSPPTSPLPLPPAPL